MLGVFAKDSDKKNLNPSILHKSFTCSVKKDAQELAGKLEINGDIEPEKYNEWLLFFQLCYFRIANYMP